MAVEEEHYKHWNFTLVVYISQNSMNVLWPAEMGEPDSSSFPKSITFCEQLQCTHFYYLRDWTQ